MRFASVFALAFLALFLCAAFALTRAAFADVLWDQLSASDYGFCSHDFETAYDCYDCLVADDFTVPEPGWIIEQIEWDALLYYGESVPVQMVHFYVFPDRGDNLGDFDNPVWVEDGMIDGTVYYGTNLYTLAAPVFFPPGHYFLGIQAKFDFSMYSKHYWVMSTYPPVGQEAHMINPAGCFGSGTDWFQPAEGYDASFALYGTLAGVPDAVIDLPLGNAVIHAGDHVLFAGTATDEDGEIVDWLWTFGEGSGVEDMHVEDPGYVQFNNPGVFTVTFNAQDDDGNWDPTPDHRMVKVGQGAGVLWDQLSAGDYYFASQDFEEAYECYDCLAADDFTVPEPGWIIEAVEWDMHLYYGSEAPVHGIHIYIMPDRGDNLGDYYNPIYSEFAPVDTVYPGTNTVTLATPVALEPGHYFFGAAPALDFELYSQCFFLTTTYAPVGQKFHMINPNGCFGSGSDWFQPSAGYDASFRLYGWHGRLPNAVIDLPLGNAVIHAGGHVLFAGTATDENGEIVDWLWTFGEGSGVDDMHVEDPGYVQFNNPGLFEVTFNAQDNDGNWDPEPDTRSVRVLNARVYVDRHSPGPEHDGLTWDTAHLTIQQGVNGCAPGGEVWVADGTYVENVVMAEDVSIYGGFLGAEDGGYEESLDQRDWLNNVTTIDGNQSGSCVVMAVDARVDGFTITNGVDSHGAGLYCYGIGDTGEIANNTIVANTASVEGGGVFCEYSSPSIEGNTFVHNYSTRGGAIYCYEASPAIIGNVMMENTADEGGALHCTYHSSPLVTGNTMIGNSAGYEGGAVFAYRGSAPTVVGNDISGNSAGVSGGGVWQSSGVARLLGNSITGNTAADTGGGVYCRSVDPPSVIANNVIIGNSSTTGEGGGIFCGTVDVTNNTICWNHAVSGGGIACTGNTSPSIFNNIVAYNAADSEGGGVFREYPASPTLSHNDFWANTPQDYYGCSPGDGDISVEPMFVDPGGGDFHLDPGSPCIDSGCNDAPGLPETDFEGDPRIVEGDGDKFPEVDIGADECVSECWPSEAPDPEPYCDGALFGEPGAGFPGWVWFSIPLDPSDCCEEENCYDPNTLLGFSCSGKLWYWDRYSKTAQVYKPPFLEWDLSVGDGYLLYLESSVENPSYWGKVPPVDFEVRLGRQGWTWVGVPAQYELGYVDFMSRICVQYPVGGVIRTAGEDYNETPYGRNWVVWGWAFWDTYSQAPRTFTPYSPFGNNTCYPWIGYRLWVNVGTARSPDDPDQVTLIWP